MYVHAYMPTRMCVLFAYLWAALYSQTMGYFQVAPSSVSKQG